MSRFTSIPWFSATPAESSRFSATVMVLKSFVLVPCAIDPVGRHPGDLVQVDPLLEHAGVLVDDVDEAPRPHPHRQVLVRALARAAVARRRRTGRQRDAHLAVDAARGEVDAAVAVAARRVRVDRRPEELPGAAARPVDPDVVEAVVLRGAEADPLQLRDRERGRAGRVDREAHDRHVTAHARRVDLARVRPRGHGGGGGAAGFDTRLALRAAGAQRESSDESSEEWLPVHARSFGGWDPLDHSSSSSNWCGNKHREWTQPNRRGQQVSARIVKRPAISPSPTWSMVARQVATSVSLGRHHEWLA